MTETGPLIIYSTKYTKIKAKVSESKYSYDPFLPAAKPRRSMDDMCPSRPEFLEMQCLLDIMTTPGNGQGDNSRALI